MQTRRDPDQLKRLPWDQFEKLDVADKAQAFNRAGNPYHTIFPQQFDRDSLERLCRLATCIRRIAKSRPGVDFLNRLLSHKRAMLYFTQPSSRTFLSFYAACQYLGLQPAEVRDAATSSELKGESGEDTLRTFSSYFDLIIMRSPRQGFAERVAHLLSSSERPIPIINAGSGKDQHPTQALLDIYTLQRSFERLDGIDGKRVMFVGDLLRGRTVRSLSCLLTNYRNVEQFFITDPRLQVAPEALHLLDRAGVKYTVDDDFEGHIPKVDAIYMTRIQDEWDQAGDTPVDIARYSFRPEHLQILRPQAILMHPLPRRQEIAVECDRDPRAMYWRQARNGMWIRVALIATTFSVADEIFDYYRMNLA